MELLAPAGSYKALCAAIYSGADAVYLGLDKFNARAKADNFNEENIKEIVDLCHLHNVKVYVTFNTLIKDSEFKEFERVVDIAAKANVDAFLVTDLGTINIFKKYDIPIHASTQMGIHNYEGAKLAKDLGFTRVVLSREALKDDIKKIKTLGLEIEYFVHGALCVSFSGGCLLSSFMSGDSGNRGLCKQPCRLPYTSSLTGEDKFYLSPSDQCFIDELKELQSWGVDSIKIEGRLKAPHYVGEVVHEYRLALDGIASKDRLEMLRRAYNRGAFTKGYNFDNTKDIMSVNVQGNIGEMMGHIVDAKDRKLYLKLDKELHLHDGVKIISNGVEIGGFLVDNIKKENNLYVINSLKVYPKDSEVHLTLDNDMVNRYEGVDVKIPIQIEFFANEGKFLTIIAKAKTSQVSENYDLVDVAKNNPVDKNTFIQKLSEVGDTCFRVEQINGQVSQNAFFPMSKLKAAKRDVLDKLYAKILDNYDKQKQRINYDKISISLPKYDFKNVLFETKKDINFDIEFKLVDLVLKIDDYSKINVKNWLIYNKIDKYILKLPKILRNKDISKVYEFIQSDLKIGAICAENISHVQIARELGLPCIIGMGMNVLNSHVKDIFDCDMVQSYELSQKENLSNTFIYSYGYVPLMTFTHCPIQINTGCTCANCKYSGDFEYINRDRHYRIVRERINSCYFNLLSPQVIDLRGFGYKKVYICASNIQDINENIINDFIQFKPNPNLNAYLGHTYLPIK